MRFLMNLAVIGSLLLCLILIVSCSDSGGDLKQITDVNKKDTNVYEDVLTEEDIINEEDVIIIEDEGYNDVLDTNITEDIITDEAVLDTGFIDAITDVNEQTDVTDIISKDIVSEDVYKDVDVEDVATQDIISEDITDIMQCTDQCQKDSKRCKDTTTLEICADFNNDGCYEYGFYKDCENGCSNNDCIQNQCEDIIVTDIEPNIPSESSGGKYETTNVNGFNDDYLYNATNYTKVGVRREWGGTIIFFGLSNGKPGMNSSNTIDANDTGREVQVAFYDPDRAMQNCAYNASCATTPTSCQNSITFLGWDPVQGGNRCNIGSGVESSGMDKEYLSVSTIPLFWNPDWDRSDCDSSGCSDPNKKNRKSDVRVIQKIRFITQHVVELDYTVINLSNLEHKPTYQEMPTMYTANGKNGTPDLWKLFDSNGNQISIDQPANDGFYYKNFTSPDGWVAMQNDPMDYGVGIYYENKLQGFQGWQLRSLPFNNVRAGFNFGIPANGTVRARAYLSLGNYDTIKAEFTELDKRLGPFGTFDVPVNDAKVSGNTQIYGWALDNKGVSSVYALIDKKINVTLNYGTDRPDVCKVWPQYNGCATNKVGFSGSYDFSKLSKCPHLIEIYAVDTDNNIRRIGAKRIYVE